MSFGGSTFLIIEVGLTILVLLIALGAPQFGDRLFQLLERSTGRLARRQWLAILLVGAAAPLLRVSILRFRPMPQPGVHDEFSHLLAAETFASGRLTNPTHPMWVHFETFHLNHQPTYMSMYPPAQGLTLAMGRVFFGHPWFGVCIAVGLMCAAICWMLYGWLPPGWALLGGFLAVLRIGLFSYWMDSYWGGALPALGGALVLGSLPRLTRRPKAGTALVLAFGAILLANSRPFEGFILMVPVVAALILWVLEKRPPGNIVAFRVAVPMCTLFLTAALLMGYYNWRVYGNPLTLPYQTNRAAYAVSPVFIWQSAGPEPVYRHPVMRDFYVNWELPVLQKAQTPGGFLDATGTKVGLLLMFFYGPLLCIPLLTLGRTLRDRRVRFLVAAGAFYLAGVSLNAFSVAHYLAPATALFYALLIQSMRHLRLCRLGSQPIGRCWIRLLPVLCTVMLFVRGAATFAHPPKDLPRTQVQRAMERLPGAQLALVRYAKGHDPMGEWVYNAADIDAAKIVWAREMNPTEDRTLVEYFKDRTVWLVEPDCNPPKVSRYSRQVDDTSKVGSADVDPRP